MVFWNDYVDKHFGWYIITQHIGSGVEAEVFTCVNLATQRAFALKLSVEDDAAWEGPNVQLPPRNAQSTRRSIEGTIGAKRSVYGRDPSTHVAEMYQVIDSQYLAPLTNTEKLKGAASIFEILAIPKWLITVNPLWEDLSLLLRADIEKLSRGNSAATTDFRERWLPILRGSRLGKNLLDTNLSQTTGASLEVLKELVHGPPADSLDIGPIFEETLVYHLHTAWVTEHYSMKLIHKRV